MPRIGSNPSDDTGKKIAAHAVALLVLTACTLIPKICFAFTPIIAADRYLPEDQNPQQTCLLSFWGVDDSGKEKRLWRCSGTVVAPNALLSAEHCRDTERVANKITLECPNGERRTIKNSLGHSTSLGFAQDMAVFKVDEALAVAPIKFVQSNKEQANLLAKPEKCLIAGWGRDASGTSGTLHAANVSGLEPDYVDLLLLTTNKNQIRIEGSLVQPGDSGGSLICTNEAGERVLVGVLSEFTKSRKFSVAEMIAPSLEWVRYAVGPLNPIDNRLFESKTQYRSYCEGVSICLESFEPIGSLTSSALRVLSHMRKDFIKLESNRVKTEKEASDIPMGIDWLSGKYEKLQSDLLLLYQKCKSRLGKLTASQ